MTAVSALAGFAAAHAVWSVSEGEVLVTFVFEQVDDQRSLLRLPGDIAAAIAFAEERIAANPAGADSAVLAFDGFITLGDWRTDAILLRARHLVEDVGVDWAVPYRPASDPAGFAIYRPKMVGLHGIDQVTRDLAQELGEGFYAGVGAHGAAADVWDRYLDESR